MYFITYNFPKLRYEALSVKCVLHLKSCKHDNRNKHVKFYLPNSDSKPNVIADKKLSLPKPT